MAADKPALLLDLARGLPVAATDVRALRAAAAPRAMSGDEYVAWLRSFPESEHEEPPVCDGPAGEPFRLP